MGRVATLVMWPGPFEQAFISPSQGGSTWNLAAIDQSVIEEKKFKILNLRDFDQGHWMSLIFGTHKATCTHSANFHIIDYNSFWKIHCFNFFPYKRIGDQLWPCHKIWFEQTWIPDAACELSRSSAFGFQRRRFLRLLPYMGMAVMFVMWSGPFEHIFIPLSHGGSNWNLASIDLAVYKKKKFENVESGWPWTKVNKWPWPLIFISVHLLI